MLDKNTRDRIKDLIGREVVPAIGCTEPVAVALAVAKATETLGGDAAPARIEVTLSGNILKNAMGVGIPGTGMIGLPIAIALGALVGKSEYGLEVLRDVNNDAVELGKAMISEGRVSVGHDPKAPDKLYIAAVAYDEDGTHSGKAVICGEHTHFVDIVKDGEVLLHEDVAAECCVEDDEMCLTLETVWKYAIESPIEELTFIKEAERLNRAAAERALKGSGFGHKVGRIIATAGKSMYGDTPARHMLAMTAGACDARMAGEPVAVMSNSGSGNQGITITLPVVTYAEEINASEEQR
ncbi:MAG: L-serine ammonia-lyase, iron-sulfur-dependent, subunit alpha, partial [Muribaculaceae bacterium]|nr:L-serine ammonia-lyase, iron-sulfur-dependent, subunit alpha [Muribaculaceae bacterium]